MENTFFTAKTYENCKRISEPFEKSGKMYVTISVPCERCGGQGRISAWSNIDGGLCYSCYGSGHFTKTVRLYTQKEMDAQARAKQAAEDRKMAELQKNSETNKLTWLRKHGFADNGDQYLICGDTYGIRTKLKEMGARFNADYRCWTSPISLDLGKDFPIVKINYSDFYSWDAVTKTSPVKDGAFDTIAELINATVVVPETAYLGEVGGKIKDVTATVKSIRNYNSQFGMGFIYTFTSENYVLVWMTTSYKELDVGDVVSISAGIKRQEEYNGIKQTYLTRARLTVIK